MRGTCQLPARLCTSAMVSWPSLEGWVQRWHAVCLHVSTTMAVFSSSIGASLWRAPLGLLVTNSRLLYDDQGFLQVRRSAVKTVAIDC